MEKQTPTQTRNGLYDFVFVYDSPAVLYIRTALPTSSRKIEPTRYKTREIKSCLKGETIRKEFHAPSSLPGQRITHPSHFDVTLFPAMYIRNFAK